MERERDKKRKGVEGVKRPFKFEEGGMGRRAKRGNLAKSRRWYSLGGGWKRRGILVQMGRRGGGSDEGDSGERGGDDAGPSAASPAPSIFPPESG